MSSQNEQRKFIRMNLDCEVNYRFPDSQRFFQGICKNFSSSGLIFSCHHCLEPGQVLDVRIIPKDTLTPTVHILIRVVLVKQNEAGLYEIASEIEGTI